MFEVITLGIVQGITEWLPVSSSAMVLLVQNTFFNTGSTISENIQLILFLHLGTFFAAIIYFWKDVKKILTTLFTYTKSSHEDKSVLNFLIISTIISGGIGYSILKIIESIDGIATVSMQSINLVIGFFLIVTALMQFIKPLVTRYDKELNYKDSLFLGFLQGISAIPGISRSGNTVAGLLLRGCDRETALRISFIMGLPITLFANIFLNLNGLIITIENILAVIFSFIFGLLTIHSLMRIARKINFGYFVLGFGILLISVSLWQIFL
tara:strand:+ start:9609 stop:10412 length:804 start_codon:yes stop_codon:yes gene_type:complete